MKSSVPDQGHFQKAQVPEFRLEKVSPVTRCCRWHDQHESSARRYDCTTHRSAQESTGSETYLLRPMSTKSCSIFILAFRVGRRALHPLGSHEVCVSSRGVGCARQRTCNYIYDIASTLVSISTNSGSVHGSGDIACTDVAAHHMRWNPRLQMDRPVQCSSDAMCDCNCV